jgi:hypothetical protein
VFVPMEKGAPRIFVVDGKDRVVEAGPVEKEK